ncbi:cation transport regulator ChaB [Arthrobacter agilis]|uniref:ChaB family protein n=1 Tax=Arthrobacter agilis TaxID=37921 RepID=UPI000B35C414|nr:ChaB family protein [Arthrobacter agilis]OUM43249.1 cation transport regulator ChaB [Arthrobacter agilis]PPB46158.1 cation transport regulator ChaB [Arthrobacter agilis]TPV25735.1 cation transport regulator ChaB [Arthrobacter agilis]
MSRFTKDGKVKAETLPSTLQRSEVKAQDTFAATLDSAEDQYGDGQRARRTAFASLKHGFEKVGDHWEAKGSKGPSDDQAAGQGADSASDATPTAGGVDANASKKHLYDLARKLDVPGRSTMTKDQLVTALQKANDRETRKAREK